MSASKTVSFLPSMKITPLLDRVVVKPLEKETQTKSGIVIPETAVGDAPQQGEVVAVGKKAPVKVGDIVLFGRYSGDDIIIKDDEFKTTTYKVMHYASLLGIVK